MTMNQIRPWVGIKGNLLPCPAKQVTQSLSVHATVELLNDCQWNGDGNMLMIGLDVARGMRQTPRLTRQLDVGDVCSSPESSPVSIQTQSLPLRALRKRKPQNSRNKRKRQLGRSSRGNHDWLLANASACVSWDFRLRNACNASDCVWMETGASDSTVNTINSVQMRSVMSLSKRILAH